MTSSNDPPAVRNAPAQDRLAEFRKMFSEIRRMMAFYAVNSDANGSMTSRVVTKKLNELQSLQALLLKAEEAIYDQVDPSGKSEAIDFEVLRDRIGRSLDRIRATMDAGQISSDPDSS